MTRSVIAGADVGGTKAHLVVATPGGRRSLVAPSASWYRTGLSAVADGLAALLSPDGLDAASALVVGAHGCDNREQCHQLESLLGERLGVDAVVLNDAELVLPAAGVEAGVGLISGTGSIAVGYDADGALLAVGGWGGYLGDEGSGTGLFRDAARAAVRAYDRGERADPLLAVLAKAVEIKDLRDLSARLSLHTRPTNWSALAVPLFERSLAAGSALAAGVLAESAAALTELVVVLGARGANTATVVAAGGMVEHADWLRQALRETFSETLPSTTLRFLDVAPVEGAVRLAGDLAALRSGDPFHGAVHPRLREVLADEMALPRHG